MGFIAMLLTGAIIGTVVYTVIKLVCLSVSKLKEIIKKRKEKKEKQRVAFGKTHKILDEDAKKIVEESPSMTMEELEKFCEENPYFVVDYDPDTDKVSDFEVIQPDATEKRVDDLVRGQGIVVFD